MRLVFLHGPAAAGKLTTARALSELVGLPVFHNHLVVNALTALFPFGSPEFVRLRELFWMETFRAAAESGRSLIFTFAPESTVPAGFPGRVRELVAGIGGEVLFVRLEVSDAEQERRIENPDRREAGKLASRETLRRLRSAPPPVRAAPDEMPADLVIDTERSTPQESARAIVERFGLEPVDQPRGFLEP